MMAEVDEREVTLKLVRPGEGELGGAIGGRPFG